MKNTENNKIVLAGEVASNPEFNHQLFGEKFYQVKVTSNRTSGTPDTLNVIISERLCNLSELSVGDFVIIHGSIRTYNKHEEKATRLIITVFAEDIVISESTEQNKHINCVEIIGYVCKNPVNRNTPLGREITDLLIGVNRQYGKSDYIPVISWGRNARFTAGLEVGTCIKITGRLQSRKYLKKISEEQFIEHTAFELSANKLEELM